MLFGRAGEQTRLQALVADARAGRAGSLVLQGEPGVGKTALLEYAATLADGMQVLQAGGIEQEQEIAFAGLYSLLHPITHRIESLPAGQQSALRAALGLSAGQDAPMPDRLAVAAGTHALVSIVAEDRPVLLLVDDLHWLDVSTTEALLFALRRFGADAVACILTCRPGAPGLARLPICDVSGLELPDAQKLVESVSGTAVSPVVAGLLRAETNGNPLALRALADVLTPQQLAGSGLPAPDLPLDVGAAVLDRYAALLAGMTPSVRLTLLIAAAAGRCSTEAVLSAAAMVGGAVTLAAAEDEGLVSVGPAGVEFAHPLLRSAAYHRATRSQQRAAHEALAAALAGTDDERAAWQLAAAATGTDERAAAALDGAAGAAIRKGAPSLAANAWERAAELSAPGDARTERLVLASEAALRAGELSRADRLGGLGMDPNVPPQLRLRLLAVRGNADVNRGRMAAARKALADAAALAEPSDPAFAAELLAQAAFVAVEAGLYKEAAQAHEKLVRLKTGSDETARFLADLAGGWLAWLRGDPEKAGELLNGCREMLAASPALSASAERQHDIGSTFVALGQFRKAYGYVDAAVELARDEGALGHFLSALTEAVWFDSQAGRWQQAVARAHQALDLAQMSDHQYHACRVLIALTEIEAAQGRDQDCREHGHQAESLTIELELPLQRLLARRHVASLDMAVGRINEAIDRYEEVRALARKLDLDHPYLSPLPDLIEALARAGRTEQARELMPEYIAQRASGSSPLPSGRLHRLHGILDEDDFDKHFQRAIGLHRQVLPFQQARSQLCYGERLRRSRRRLEARAQLRAAIETFDRLDARPWADRGRAELRAAGEAIADGGIGREQLTPQELQIALLVSEGKSNAETSRALFLSTRTVEFHLSRAYRKLGVASRTELTRLMTGAELTSSWIGGHS
jgi:DNA-binding CsgD family transcriptional regulator